MFDHGGMASVAVRNLDELAERVRPVALRSEQPGFPVLPWLEPLLPIGLPRGGVVSVSAAPGVAGASTLALAVAAGPSQAGAWVALVGDVRPPDHARRRQSWGLVAAAELGVVFERLVVVAPSEPPASGWAPVVAVLLEGFPIVVLGEQARLRPNDSRRLTSRLRERGGALVRLGPESAAAQSRLMVRSSSWEPTDPDGPTPFARATSSRPVRTGHLHHRRLLIEATGRGPASRPRHAEIRLPSPRTPRCDAG